MNDAPTSGDRQRRRIEHELVNVLERTRLLRGQASRQLMVEQVRDRLGPLPLHEHPQLRLQVVELVHVCARQPNGVHELVEVVKHLEPGTEELVQLLRLRDEWEAVDVLAAEDWTELRPILTELAPGNLSLLYQRATEHRLPGPPAWCANAWHAFVHLAGQNAGPDGLPPSMVFLALLEQEVSSQVAQRIRKRNQRLASEQGLTAELDTRRAHIDAGHDRPTDATAYLVIQIEPVLDPDRDGDTQELYTISHFRQWHGVDAWHSRQGHSRQVHRRDLEQEVERLVEQMETEWSDRPGTVVVEFVLPWELLNAEVDWWHKESTSSRPTALAMDYPIVIRSLERLRTPRWHRVWHQRWRQLRNAPASSAVYWSRPSGKDYFTRLETELKADERVVSLVLSEPPSRLGQTGQLEVEAALRAGLPVIIWHRSDCTSAAFKEAVTRLISDGGLAQLPLRAKELRLEALRLEPELREDHIGRHLAVLWDDPERRPDSLGSPSGRTTGETR